MNRDTELLKIQVYASYCHSTFRGRVAFVFGLIVAYCTSLLVLNLQKTMDLTTYFVSMFMAFPVLALFLWTTYSRYQRRLNRVNELIEMVNKGESLPSIEDMIKGKGLET